MDNLLECLNKINTDDIIIENIPIFPHKISMIKNRNYVILFYKNQELKLYYSDMFNKKYINAKLIDLLYCDE